METLLPESKTNLTPQRSLPLRLELTHTFENFIPGKNKECLTSLLQWMHDSTQGSAFYLWGTQGSGCSHLLQACCHSEHQRDPNLPLTYLPLKELHQRETPQLFSGLENLSLICIDDIQCIIGVPQWEEALFHLYNRALNQNCKLLLGSKTSLKELPFTLADLQSRFQNALNFCIQPLNDEEKIQALQKNAQQRGLELKDDAANFLLNRHSRNMQDLIQTLDALDVESLHTKRKLTIPFIKLYLEL